jgi:isoquinoline 1-oxidoreductase
MKPLDAIQEQAASECWQHDVERLEHGFQINRRDLFKVFGAGVVVCVAAKSGALQESGGRPRGDNMPDNIASWIHIAENGAVTVFTGKVEMGQNIRTSLTQQVAEELRVRPGDITLTMGDTDLTPYDMGTFGSRTTPQMGTQLRNISAGARELLIEMAARRWNVQPNSLVASNGSISTRDGAHTATYGELTRGERIVKVIGDDPPTTPPAEWKIAGEPLAKIDGRAFVTGSHRYTSDMTRPGMLYGKVLRPAGFNATLTSLDDSGARGMPGVQVVRDGNFVAVAAPDAETALRAVQALRAQWSVPPQPSDSELFDYLRKNVEPAQGREHTQAHQTGSVETGLASADQKINVTYTVAYIAHAPLEPRAAVAEWEGDKLTVWTGTQRPFAVKDELAQAFHVASNKVRVLVPDTGSAYGGKHTGDAAVEAARLAKAAGKPVKLVWTREEEFTWAYFRPAGVIDVRASARNDGTLVSWEFDNYNSGPAAITTPYVVSNQRVEFHASKSPLRPGSYRALAATANHFARESAMDELAHAIKMDPLQFRLKNISDARLRAVFETAAKRFGWGQQKSSPERGFGIAGGFEKGGYIATCAEVAVDRKSGTVHIVRVTQAWDCGPVVNPEGIRNQIAGAITQAIGGALFEAIQFNNGRILNPHFAQYRVPRFTDVPVIEVDVIDRRDEKPFGAGETPIVGLAPAVGNAIFSATGVRLRSMPLVPQGMPKSS